MKMAPSAVAATGIKPGPKHKGVFLRIAAGTEDLETLWWIRCAIVSLKAGWFLDDKNKCKGVGPII